MRVRKRVVLVGMFFLVIVSLMFFVNETIFKKEDTKEAKIAVITNGGDLESFFRLENGINRAKKDFNVNIEFINIKEKNNKEEQRKVLNKKLEEEKVDAIIISPVEYNYIKKDIEDREKKMPVIIIESKIEKENKQDYKVENIPYDNKKIGYKIGDEVISRGNFNKEIVILNENRDCIKERIEGFKESIEMTKNTISFIDIDKNKIWEEKIKNILKDDKKVVIAFDMERLDEVGRIKDSLKEEGEAEVYGVGTNNYLIRALENRNINGISVQSEFNMGYLAVKKAVELIKGDVTERVVIDSRIINYENMYYENNQKILFPFIN